MKLESFARELKSRYVPSYAWPRMYPSEIWEYFKTGRVTRERTVSGKKEILVLDKKAQASIWDKLCKVKTFGSMCVAITSDINDYMAHEVAGLLNYSWLQSNMDLKFKWVTPSWTQEKHDITCRALFIRSVLPIEERLYEIRDLIDKHPNAISVVILGGMNGIEFFDDYLKLPLHAAIHLDGSLAKMPLRFYPSVKQDQGTGFIPPFVIPHSLVSSVNITVQKKSSK